MVKFLLAKQAFESHSAQTDVRDVLDQYRVGHSSILYRIKEIQSDLSLLVGKVQTNGRKMQESRTGLLERIQSFEKIQTDFDTKLDQNFGQLLALIENLSKTISDTNKQCSHCSSDDNTSLTTISSSVTN